MYICSYLASTYIRIGSLQIQVTAYLINWGAWFARECKPPNRLRSTKGKKICPGFPACFPREPIVTGFGGFVWLLGYAEEASEGQCSPRAGVSSGPST